MDHTGFQHATHGGRAEMKSGAGERRSQSSGTHPWTENPQAMNEIGDKLGKPIDGLSNLDERVRAFVVETVRPRGDGQWRDEEPPSGFCLRPASRGAQFEDRETFDRRVVWPALRRYAFHPRVLDSEFFTQERGLAVPLVELGLEPDSHVEMALGPGSRKGEREIRHRDGIHDGRAEIAWPAAWERDRLRRGRGQRQLRRLDETTRMRARLDVAETPMEVLGAGPGCAVDSPGRPLNRPLRSRGSNQCRRSAGSSGSW